ncbi:MAG: hupL [Clostridiaceae bacterium]|jgi:hydrogenase large subunit|nr:hupL [Clostridiaceae bacterium]
MGKLLQFNNSVTFDDSIEIQVTIDNHIVVDSKCCDNSYMDLKTMFKNKSPAAFMCFTENIYGICSKTHSIAASIALENAYGITPDININIIRDIIHGLEFLQHHFRHFYMFTVPYYVKLANVPTIFSPYSSDFRLSDSLNKKINHHYLESIKCIKITNEILAVFNICVSDRDKIVKLKSLISFINNFIESYMMEDLNILSYYYKDYYHKGASTGNFMSFGAFNNEFYDDFIYVKPGVLIDNNLENLNTEYISEDTYNSWFKENLKLPFPNNNPMDINLNKSSSYTFIKALRYNGYTMEVGALSRMILSGNYKLGNSCLDRINAIVLETRLIANLINRLCDLTSGKTTYSTSFAEKSNCCGASYLDTSTGAISHYINIKSSKIVNYNILSPYFWNLSPKDMNNIPGALETALLGTYIDQINNPIEIIRIINSFGLCIPYKVHVLNGNKVSLIINIK